jgi:hypothetical protein
MLGTYPGTREAELLRQIKSIAENLDYTAPELKAERRKMALIAIRRLIREWEQS